MGWLPRSPSQGRAPRAFSCRILDTSPYRAGAYQSREVRGVIRPAARLAGTRGCPGRAQQSLAAPSRCPKSERLQRWGLRRVLDALLRQQRVVVADILAEVEVPTDPDAIASEERRLV
jgi:hypothetical protein